MNLESTLVGTPNVAVDLDLVLSGQGIPSGARPGDAVLAAARRVVEAAPALVTGQFVRTGWRVSRHSARAVDLAAGRLEGDGIAGALRGARLVIAAICTVGPRLDDRVSELLAEAPLDALAFDGLGSAVAERLAGAVCAEIEQHAEDEGLQVTGPLMPGMIGWPLLEAQRQLFALVDPGPIGVTLSAAGQMIPRKSLSFVVGVGAHVRRHERCSVCELRDRCKFRPIHG